MSCFHEIEIRKTHAHHCKTSDFKNISVNLDAMSTASGLSFYCKCYLILSISEVFLQVCVLEKNYMRLSVSNPSIKIVAWLLEREVKKNGTVVTPLEI